MQPIASPRRLAAANRRERGAVGTNGGAAQPARGTARLGAEDHSVLVADGEGAARLRGGAGARCAPPLTALPPPLCRILGEAPRGGERRLQPEPPGEGARSQEGGKGGLLKRGAKNVLAGLAVCAGSGLSVRCWRPAAR